MNVFNFLYGRLITIRMYVQGHRGRRRIEKDPNAEDKEKPYVCEGEITFMEMMF